MKYRTDPELQDQFTIDRLEELLKAKAEEYKIFGITGEDVMRDCEIRQKIQVLKNSLRL